jgi:concanavalin A-like lectin/glucanase superfamily protein
MGDVAVLDFGSGDFTVEIWAKTTQNGERTLVSKRASGPYWQLTVTDDPGHTGEIRVNVSAGTSREVYGPEVRVDDGAWHHIVAAFDRDVGITVFVDGASRFTAGAFTGPIDNAAPFLVGKSTGYGYFGGDLDEVAVYPTLLSAARIQAHHLAGRG